MIDSLAPTALRQQAVSISEVHQKVQCSLEVNTRLVENNC